MHHAHNSFVKDLEQVDSETWWSLLDRQVGMHYNIIMQKIYIVLGHVH